MSDWAELVIDKGDPLLTTPFMIEMVRQMRAVDRYGVWEKSGDHEILDPFVMTKQRKRELPVIGDPDEEVLERVKVWFNALSAMIELRTGHMAGPLINITYEGFGRALIAVGKLIVHDRTLRDIHRFGFRSLEAMQQEADRIVSEAVRLIEAHADVAAL